ncbi:MAG: ABC transporter substrate-binding protein [Dictyoglomus sp. NZ13-RE01]|nr:MAG: ABC transporter substrate-binding protein [Dictyoglomus sp. NZ13-RE01]
MKSYSKPLLILLLSFIVFFTISLGQQTKAVKLSIIDVAGNLQLTQTAIENFKKAHPEIVSDIEYMKATAPELPAKIKAQQMAGNVVTTMVLTGYDAMAAGLEMDIWENIYPTYASYFPNLESRYLPGAREAFKLFKGYGIVVSYCPGGPMFTYNPEKVKKVPTTAEELLEWAKANPGKFMYARPANSGPGRCLLQGLPYILGDKNPKDPKTWEKTWNYLKELDKYIDYYPTGTAITFRELAEGTRWIIASHLGWDMNQRILGVIPANFKGFFLKNTTWLTDAHFMCMPKGLDEARKRATLALMAWLLRRESQALIYDNGYFYPGPAISNVPLSLAPKEIQDKIKSAMRPEYEKAIKEFPTTTQLGAKELVEAFEMWDKLVGSKVK